MRYCSHSLKPSCSLSVSVLESISSLISLPAPLFLNSNTGRSLYIIQRGGEFLELFQQCLLNGYLFRVIKYPVLSMCIIYMVECSIIFMIVSDLPYPGNHFPYIHQGLLPSGPLSCMIYPGLLQAPFLPSRYNIRR